MLASKSPSPATRLGAWLRGLLRIDAAPAPLTHKTLQTSSGHANLGLRVGYVRYTLDPCDLSDAELRTHVLVLGRAGDEASLLTHSLALQQMARGGSCLFIGQRPNTFLGRRNDTVLRGNMRRVAEAQGRGADLCELDCEALTFGPEDAPTLRDHFETVLQDQAWLHVAVPSGEADDLARRVLEDLRVAAARVCVTASAQQRAGLPALVFVPLELSAPFAQHAVFLSQARAANLAFVFYGPSPAFHALPAESSQILLANTAARIALGGHPTAQAQKLVTALNFDALDAGREASLARTVAALRVGETCLWCRGKPVRRLLLPALPI